MTSREALIIIKLSIKNLEYNDILDQEALLTIEQALTDYERLQRDVASFLRLVTKPTWLNTVESVNYDYLKSKLSKVGK